MPTDPRSEPRPGLTHDDWVAVVAYASILAGFVAGTFWVTWQAVPVF